MLRTLLFVLFSLLTTPLLAQLKIAGHRGGYYHQYPESSFPLFQFIADQFQGDTIIIEIDLRTSKDRTIYLLHDETLDRTTTGSGKINDQSDSYIHALTLKTKSGVKTAQHIPTLEETLTFIRTRNINLMLDIKEPIHQQVLELVKKHKLENRVLVLTFRKEYTQLVAEKYPTILLSALIETEADLEFFKKFPRPINKRIAYVNSKTTTEWIQKLRAEKILIMADVSEDLRNNGKPLTEDGYKHKVQQQQLDILISDFPLEARADLK